MKAISKYAAILSLSEMGLGSLLHSFKLPFAGTLLCLNQIFLLTKASKEMPASPYAPFVISSISALLKALAPAGKKITPMIAICMQGALYTLCLILLGNNRIARMASGICAISFSALQSLFFYYLIFGNGFFDLVFSAILMIASLKIALALFTVCLAEKMTSVQFDHYFHQLILSTPNRSHSPLMHPFQGALKDLFKPLFLLSALFATLIAPEALTVIRIFGLGFFCFYLGRLIPADRFISWLRTKRETPLNQLIQSTLLEMQAMQSLPLDHEDGLSPGSDGSRSVQT